jgi:predicted Zn-dependent protease
MRVLLTLLLLAMGTAAFWQVSHWRDSGTLSARALNVYPELDTAKLMRLQWMVAHDDPDAALRVGLSILPSRLRGEIAESVWHLHLGDAYSRLGMQREASEAWRASFMKHLQQWRAQHRLARQSMREQRWEHAKIELTYALQAFDQVPEVWDDLATVARELGDWAQEASAAQSAVEVAGLTARPRMLVRQGDRFALRGRREQAREAYLAALALKPLPEARAGLAALASGAAPAVPVSPALRER